MKSVFRKRLNDQNNTNKDHISKNNTHKNSTKENSTIENSTIENSTIKNSTKERIHRTYSPKVQKRIDFLNRYSLLFHILLACGTCFVIEWVSRHSFLEACRFAVDRNLVFLYNAMIVYTSLLLVYIAKRRAVLRTIICAIWLFLGIINGCVLAKRVTPFGFTDIKMVGDLFTMQSNYFSAAEAAVVITAVVIVVLSLIYMWFRGPKFKGHQHKMTAVGMMLFALTVLPQVTDAAVDNNILTTYFENLAQGYKDYGFVYSFSASVLDRGMSAPEAYSEDSVAAVLAKVDAEPISAAADYEASEGFAQETAESVIDPEEVHKEITDLVSDPAQARQRVSFLTADAQQDSQARDGQLYSAVLEPMQKIRTTAPDELNTERMEEIPGEDSAKQPNIICVLLESFVDPGMIRFLEMSEDPIPNFHALYDTYSSGYLEVPVVGAGTANTEFEILTGMGMQFFGLGEYPYKTVLKETNCESIAADLKTLGYGAHAVHNNGGNFYSRKDVFSMMGFDTFTSKEMMNITEYTPIKTWPTDDILVGEVEKSLDYTPDQPDFVYTITVEGHGDYPKEEVLTDPEIEVIGAADEGMEYAWEYYVNQIHQVDDFIGDLIAMLEARDEPTFVVMFGDHLPTMGLTEEDMRTGSLFQTQYVTWNNFGLEKKDGNMKAYQLLADLTEQLGIQNGTMFTFHQNRDRFATEEEYQQSMELLQYDILYGERYVYGGADPYPATEIVMGTQDVVIRDITEGEDYYYISGDNFTKWSRVFVNGEKVSTKYISGSQLWVKKSKLEDGINQIVVNQIGSSDSVFRTSNEFTIEKLPETEAKE